MVYVPCASFRLCVFTVVAEAVTAAGSVGRAASPQKAIPPFSSATVTSINAAGTLSWALI